MSHASDNNSILPAGRRAGVGLHLASLPGPYGIGDIGDSALSFIEALADMHLSVWQFLPTGPTAYGDSPYQPLSAFAGNENLIGIEPLIRFGLLSKADAGPLEDLPADFIDYGKLIPLKSTILASAADRFKNKANSKLKSSYREFLHEHDAQWLDDYALYRTLKTWHGERPWPEWDRPFLQRDPAAISRIRVSLAPDIERIKLLQFLFSQQWQSLREHADHNKICLFADMPIYIALDSADAWAHPEILHIDGDGHPTHVAGVPPDYFSEDGQMWGNPLYDWNYHATHAFQWWIERMRHATRLADLVRIDHFRGFEAYWSIPFAASTARNGRWEQGPGDALFDALRDALGHMPIVAEDLGVITAAVDALRRRHQIPGMRVLQFDFANADFRPAAIEENSVCYTGTHDNDTTVGWFRGGDNDTRTTAEVEAARANALRWTGGTAQTIHSDMIRFAFATRARLAIAPMQDYLGLGSEARLNIPGTSRDNWRWRLQLSQLTGRFRKTVRKMVRESSRG